MLLSNYLHNGELLAAQAAAAVAMHYSSRGRKRGSRSGSKSRTRHRRTVRAIYDCLGGYYFRRAYRMMFQSFCKLHEKIKEGIEAAHKEMLKKRRRQHRKLRRNKPGDGRGSKPNLPPIPNGTIHTSVRRACALRYFAGGSPVDIMVQYGISYTEVIDSDSVWYVVEATNKVEEWFISYPSSRDEQLRIANEFKSKSAVEFDVCAGTIDGVLIWIHKPTIAEAKRAAVDQLKLFCGRKHKYGLNCQVVCDARGRFLDISITYGGASSDLLAFENSELFERLQNQNLLHDGLVLFGDNAYLNSPFMATPYTNVSSGPKDNYNFYHSQLRIRIECAFGMLVQRWGILRMAMPKGISIKKTITMVNALAKLHNFCINEVDGESRSTMIVDEPLAADTAYIEGDNAGFVSLSQNLEASIVLNENVDTPDDLIGGGDHFDDIPRAARRVREQITLPRTRLCDHVAKSHKVPNRMRCFCCFCYKNVGKILSLVKYCCDICHENTFS